MSSGIVTAFAPATVGNVGIGFDILGHTVKVVGDRVSARRVPEPGVRITGITGSQADLPLEAEKNTAGMALVSMVSALSLPFGIEISIEKGIPRCTARPSPAGRFTWTTSLLRCSAGWC